MLCFRRVTNTLVSKASLPTRSTISRLLSPSPLATSFRTMTSAASMATPNTFNKTTVALFHDPEPNTLSLITRPIPTPNLSADEHIIRVHTTAPCAGELTWWTFGIPKPPSDHIPGQDVAGTVALAPALSPFQPGDRIYARIPWNRPGALQDYTMLLGSEMAQMPENMDFEHAATVPMSALTAWQGLFEQAGFTGPEDERIHRDKKTVLITAASGNVGKWAIQLARIAGFERIVGTYGGGAEVERLLKELGATDLIDYKKSSLAEWVAQDPDGRKVDLVFDCFGRSALADAWNAVKDGGQLLSVCEPPETRKPAECQAKDVTNFFFVMDSKRGKELGKVTKWLESGECKAFLDSVHDLKDYQKAFDRVEGRHADGKVVIKVLDHGLNPGN